MEPRLCTFFGSEFRKILTCDHLHLPATGLNTPLLADANDRRSKGCENRPEKCTKSRERQFTATVYLFHENRVLLHKHPKLNKWLPPGGHIEANETPPEAARREVKEETGLDLIFIEQENLKVNAYNAVSFERPFLCLLENIPEYKDKPAHQHMDFIYLGKPLEIRDCLNGFRWVSWEELQGLEIFPDTLEVLRILLKESGLNNLQPEELFRPLS